MTIGMMMTISQVITKHYTQLKAKCHNDDRIISLSRTSQDVLHDVIMTALRKYRDQDIVEGDGLLYLEKTLWYELKFQRNRIDPKCMVVDDLGKYDRPAMDEGE